MLLLSKIPVFHSNLKMQCKTTGMLQVLKERQHTGLETRIPLLIHTASAELQHKLKQKFCFNLCCRG